VPPLQREKRNAGRFKSDISGRTRTASMIGPFEHEIAPPVARLDQGQLGFPYGIAPYLNPAIRPQKRNDLVFPNQIIKHVRRDDPFLTIGKNNRHAFLRNATTAETATHLPQKIKLPQDTLSVYPTSPRRLKLILINPLLPIVKTDQRTAAVRVRRSTSAFPTGALRPVAVCSLPRHPQ
jgi:hypothetical protein